MTFDPQKLLDMPPVTMRREFTPRDTMLYALSIGADELRFTYEKDLQALPMMAAVMAYPGFMWRDPALSVDWKQVLHAEQSVEIHTPLPHSVKIYGETVIEAIHDKGADKGSLVQIARTVINEQTGETLATIRGRFFLRGNGGHGVSHGPTFTPYHIPEGRQPDAVINLTTAQNQAALYRLSGDYNPLHIDPKTAKAAGFDKPILHGLCTYGIVGRALLLALCDNNPQRLQRMDVRFTAPVYPGETIVTEIWRDGEGKAAFCAKVKERDLVILNNGCAHFM